MHLFLLSFLTQAISEHANRVETIFIDEWDNGPVEQEYKNHSFPRDLSNRRRTDDGAFEPIRFHIHIEDKGLDADTAEYLTAVVGAAVGYLSKIMRVSPVEGNLLLCSTYRQERKMCKDTCGEVKLPYKHVYEGIPNADTVLYAFADANAKWCSGGAVYAYAGMCFRDIYGRPIAGRINFCKLQGRRRKWRSDVEVALHEIAHIIYASTSFFGRFRDEDGNLRRESEVWKKVNDGLHQRGYVITPRVKEWVRDHFSCRSLIGAELESQGESYTQWKHWDAQYFFEDILTGYIDGSPRTFSGLNLALMEDSGWYEANWGKEGKMKWGRGKGCTFASGSCVKSGYPNSDHYCNDNKRGCTHWARGIGACDIRTHGSLIPSYFQYFRDSSKGGDKYANYCPIMKPMIDQNEFTSMCNDEADNWLLDMVDHGSIHSAESRCVEGVIARPGYKFNGAAYSICYPHTCVGTAPDWEGVKIRIFDKDILCLKADVGKKKSLGGGYSGSVKCPVLDEICPADESNPLYCDNGDWRNVGTQGEGYCECWPGFSGPKCTAYFRESHSKGCYWDDAHVKIQHDSILSSDQQKIVKSIGGMGPSRYTVELTYMRWSSRKDTGCKALGYSVKNLIVALWEGSCSFEQKALNAQNGGAKAVLIVSKNNFGHNPLADSSSVRIPVRQVPSAFGTWLLKQSGSVKASIKCHEMIKVHNSPSSLIKEIRAGSKFSLEAPIEQTCEPIHMYPTESNGEVPNTLGSMEIPFPVHSVGFSFTSKSTLKLAGARFKATLSQGTKGRFTLYNLDDVVARTSWFHGIGRKDFYTAMFSTVQILQRDREYTLAFWIDETRGNTGAIATYPIYFTIDDPYENDIATNIVISHSFKKEKLPSRPEPFSPVFDICVEA